MKRYFIPGGTLLCWLMALSSFAQHADSLIMFRTFGGAAFEYKKDTSIFSVSPKQVLQIMKDDPLAYEEFKKAKSNYSMAGVMGFIGGALIVFPVVSAIAGGDPEWGLAAGGAALIIASIPFTKAFRRHAQGSIDTYNKKHTAFRPRTQFFFSGIGARVLIRF